MTVIYAILIFCLLIVFHEFGHFAAAKLCGVKVNEFSVGMGPAILKKQKGDTLYSIRLFPIGGFCAMEGEDEEFSDERAFHQKAAWQKALIVVAGAFMNLLLAVLIMIGVAYAVGTPTTTIDTVTPGSPAELAGIHSGDTLTAVDGKSVEKWSDISVLLAESEADRVQLTVKGEDGTERIVSSGVMTNEAGRRMIGIVPTKEHHLLDAAGSGVKNTWTMGSGMLQVIRQLFTGRVAASELSGPVGIVAAVNQTASLGFIYIAYLTALISLNLAIVNMLPFPALDGGRLVFIVIRKITGHAITDEIESKVHFAGIMLLFALMIYVTWHDVIRFILPIFS